MPEKINDITIFSLSDVTKSIQKTITARYTSAFWIKAELNKLNFYKQSGHCFPELVEKKADRVVAQLKSTIWKDDFDGINNRFLSVLNEPLKDGIKILFLATISFDAVYGLSLRILDIDPAYTLGDLEKEKQETISKLKKENLFDLNKTRTLSLLPQRIAIISDETSKGYADFLRVIQGNPRGYRFFHFLFPSLLQGERAVNSIIGQLNRIRKVKDHFDVVAIIRGGGDDIGLSCFNHYQLAREIAYFPMPVITGIGHATNETVVEMISYSNAITPTKLAEYLLQLFNDYADPVFRAEERIMEKAVRMIQEGKQMLHTEVKLFNSATENILQQNQSEIKILASSVFRQSVFHVRTGKKMLSQLAVTTTKAVQRKLSAEKQNAMRLQATISAGSVFIIKNRLAEIISLEKNVLNMSPENVLKRGYSITMQNGKAIKNAKELKAGDLVDTILFQGNISSTVNPPGKK